MNTMHQDYLSINEKYLYFYERSIFVIRLELYYARFLLDKIYQTKRDR